MEKADFVVVGDMILDRFFYGDAVRISPEAPALVLDVREEKYSVGGAFNVFSHLASLGGGPRLVTVTGGDIDKFKMDFPELEVHKNDVTFVKDDSRVTTVKTRLIALYKLSYLARFDKEVTTDISMDHVALILDSVRQQLRADSCLLIVDYKKGVVTAALAQGLIAIAQERRCKVFIDSKRDRMEFFSGAYLFKPNKVEFHEIKLRYQLSQFDDIEACRHLIKRFDLENIVLTLGDRGILAVNKSGNVISIPGHSVPVKELSGAGDSVLAVIACLIHLGHPLERALEAANNIAAQFVSTGVTYRARTEDLFPGEAAQPEV